MERVGDYDRNGFIDMMGMKGLSVLSREWEVRKLRQTVYIFLLGKGVKR